MNFDFLKAVVLGIVEGVTEFLPVSSTGHLIVAGEWVGFTGERAKTFEIFIQLGAILAIMWLYRGTIFNFSKLQNGLLRNIFVAFLPAAIFGLLLHGFIKESLFSISVVAVSLIIGGVVILIIERFVKRFSVNLIENISLRKAFSIGAGQILSLVPGVSRSGATIMTGLVAGLDRKTATEFSFFLAIPTMLAATLYDLWKSASVLTENGHAIVTFQDIPMFAVGFLTAFVSAFIVVKLFIKYVSTHTFSVFAWYRIVFGLLLLL